MGVKVKVFIQFYTIMISAELFDLEDSFSNVKQNMLLRKSLQITPEQHTF